MSETSKSGGVYWHLALLRWTMVFIFIWFGCFCAWGGVCQRDIRADDFIRFQHARHHAA
jgi:hypothetical protein